MQESKLDLILEKLDRIENEQQEHGKILVYHSKILEQHSETLKQHSEKFDKQDQHFTSLEHELKEFREETRADLQVLKGGQKGLRNEITDRFREVKKDMNKLEKNQTKQQRTLECLSMRSIEQEAAITKLQEV